MKHISNLVYYLLLVFLILSSIALLYLILLAHFKYTINISHAPTNRRPRNESRPRSGIFFLGNTIVAIIAAFSINFARSQIKHAEELAGQQYIWTYINALTMNTYDILIGKSFLS